MHAPEDTIAAIASAPGSSATGAVRLSGPAALAALAEALDSPAAQAGAHVRRFALGDGRSVAVRVAVFCAPKSYTGEDAAEILAPGNPSLLVRVLERVCALKGVRLAGPGEFTQRAFLNGRLSVEQAEGVAAMIAARSEEERLAARRLLSGEAGAAQRALAEACADLLALVEAGVDFSDQEDVRPIAPAALRDRLEALAGAITRALGGGAGARLAPDKEAVRVVIAGAPNAGKSTLFNALLGRERAIVSAEAGATRDAIEEPLNLGAEAALAPAIILVDMAGLDEALSRRSQADAAAQRRAREALADADVVVHCDPSGRFKGLPDVDAGAITLRVRTKADLPTEAASGPGALAVCALDGWRLDALKRAIGDAASSVGRATALARVAPRHVRALTLAHARVVEAKKLAGAQGAADALAHEEIIAQALREALDALGQISGATPPDDVLGRIFATFCVGK